MFLLKQLYTAFRSRVKMRPPDWQWEQMRRWGSGRGSFGDGADVNHFHHWFTRTQHALSANAPTPFIYAYSSTFSFCCIKTPSHTHTHCRKKPVHDNLCTHIHTSFSVELHSVGANTADRGRRESLINAHHGEKIPINDRIYAERVSKSEGT